MDLKSGYPFWPVRDGLPENFPPLCQDLSCDVLVVGAGITGALIARTLAHAGLHVVVIDKRDAGWGSTAASTALLQYEIDTELADLSRRFGEESAVAAYRACEQAIDAIAEIAATGGVAFRRNNSLYFASRWHHTSRLRAEGELRKRHGFELELLERAELRERTGIRASFGLLTAKAALIDPYRFTYSLLGKLRREGVQVFDRSAMLSWAIGGSAIEVLTERDVSVRCRNLVLAAGYEAQQYLPRRAASNRSSYAVATEPVRQDLGPLKHMMMWESARPYLYLRTTTDGRVIVGGEDDRLDLAVKRDASVPRKAARLMRKLHKLVPGIPFESGFAWAGTFAETDDGLPFFGPHRNLDPRIHFAMAYGGNGITYALVGAEILRARITGNDHPLMGLFSFDRIE